jgi:hypothetical protein
LTTTVLPAVTPAWLAAPSLLQLPVSAHDVRCRDRVAIGIGRIDLKERSPRDILISRGPLTSTAARLAELEGEMALAELRAISRGASDEFSRPFAGHKTSLPAALALDVQEWGSVLSFLLRISERPAFLGQGEDRPSVSELASTEQLAPSPPSRA